MFSKKRIKAYWWKERPNFGDALAPYLLEHFTNKKFSWDTISHSSVVSIGSVLEHIPPLWDGYVLGSGRLFQFSRIHLKSAKVISVRGPLSAKGILGNFAIGDPGILSNELVGPQDKQWDLGIIPHWQDDELSKKFTRLIKPQFSIKTIDPSGNPIDVVKQIGACRRVVTSSLHGMIVADSFGIPRRVEICSKMERDGGDFKFRDYSASIKTPFVTGKMEEPSRFRVDDVKFEVYDAYRELERAL